MVSGQQEIAGKEDPKPASARLTGVWPRSLKPENLGRMPGGSSSFSFWEEWAFPSHSENRGTRTVMGITGDFLNQNGLRQHD